jgi:hypothetical protein
VPLGAAAAEPDTFEGFDGIGRSEEAYAPAELDAVLIAEDGGIVSLSISGFQRPLAILVGQAEALALLHSAGADLRRPSTLATWRHCLAVRASPQRPPVLARPCNAVPGSPAKGLEP